MCYFVLFSFYVFLSSYFILFSYYVFVTFYIVGESLLCRGGRNDDACKVLCSSGWCVISFYSPVTSLSPFISYVILPRHVSSKFSSFCINLLYPHYSLSWCVKLSVYLVMFSFFCFTCYVFVSFSFIDDSFSTCFP